MGSKTSREDEGGRICEGKENENSFNVFDPAQMCGGMLFCCKEPDFGNTGLTAKKPRAKCMGNATPRTMRQLVGIGAILSCVSSTPRSPEKTSGVVFSSFAPGSSSDEASKRGELQVGDMLEEIEEQKISSASVYEVASLLLGPVGTRVKLKIRRRNTGGEVFTVELERRQTSVSTMQSIVEADSSTASPSRRVPSLQPGEGTVSIII